jgi:magnesium-transporting ATPase (P-type)
MSKSNKENRDNKDPGGVMSASVSHHSGNMNDGNDILSQQIISNATALPSPLSTPPPPGGIASSQQAVCDKIVMIGSPQIIKYCDNSIKTAKYEWYSFLPKFLLEEFNPKTKFANCYFLVICGLQVVPPITNTNGYPTVLIPLFGVLLLAAIIKAFEDLKRHQSDKLANSSITEIFNREKQQFEEKQWNEVVVGDFIRVKSRAVVPADIIVFQVWEPNQDLPKGACFIETKSLDGETNLKHRQVLPALLGKVRS